ncbi:MAG: hypothetical protein ACOYXC_15160, partial [Candidatus Rifleibacteriota bacterium]
ILPIFSVIFILGLQFSQLGDTDLSILYFLLTAGAILISWLYRVNQKVSIFFPGFCRVHVRRLLRQSSHLAGR